VSNLTGGQIVGGVIGGIIGAVTAGPVGAFKGVAIGLSLGGYIDPPNGPTMRGPTLDDKSFQSSTYGVVLSRLYGRVAITGNVFYLENNEYKAVDKSKRVGGKGGGGQKVVTTTYYATFAVALGTTYAGSKPYRVWAGGKLILGGELTGIEKVDGKIKKLFDYRYYDGTQTAPDPRMEAVKGVGNCPSYEGTAYIIFYDFELTEYGNGLAGCPIKVELFAPDPADEIAQNDISTFAVQTEVDFVFPDNLNNTVGCSIAVYQGGRYAVYSTGFYNDYYHRFGTISGVGLANEINHVAIESVYLHTNNQQSNAIRWAFRSRFEDPPAPSIFYTNIGNVATPFPLDPLNQEFASLFVLLSVEGVNYAVYLLLSNTPPEFGLPPGTLFVTLFGSDQIRIVLGDFSGDLPINFAISLGKFYFLSAQNGPWVLKVFNISDGAPVATELITVPGTIAPDDLIAWAAEIFNGSYYCGGVNSGAGTLFAIGINLTTFVCTVAEVPIAAISGTVLQADSQPLAGGGKAGQFSIYNGVIGICIFIGAGSDVHGHIYTFAAPVIDYSNPDDFRTDIIGIIESELNAVGIPASDYDLTELTNETTIGYRVTEVTSARAAIGPIQSAYLFDWVERGYQLVAVRRGGVSVAQIPFTKLVLSGDSVVKTQDVSKVLIPSMLTLNYIDYDREFDAGSQSAIYPAAFDNVQAKELPIVMQSDEAARLADIFLRSMWTEVKKYEFSLPYTYMELRLGDVITVEVYPGRYVAMRIDQRTFDIAGLVTLGCTATSPLTYLSDALGYSGETPSDIYIPVYADPIPIVLDIPLIRDEQDVYGIAAVVMQEPPTTQSALMVSANNGVTFTEIGRFDGPGVIAQSSTDSLGPGDPFVTEYGTDLVLDNVISGEFFSVTYEEMLRNNNTIAYGQPGRWEILTYQDATPTGVGDGVVLSTFVRGKYGTEQYMDDHIIGDFVVLLDHPNTIFGPLPAQALGLSWPIKAVNVGDDEDGGTLANYGTYEGVNLKPLSVVNPDVRRGGLDWIIDFDPRTRYPSNQWVTGNIEQTDTQYYAVDIFNGAAIVRTIQSSTIPVIYTEAQQIADFGSAQTSITIDIYQVNQRVGRGYPLRVTT
jgi:hypothetical protein